MLGVVVKTQVGWMILLSGIGLNPPSLSWYTCRISGHTGGNFGLSDTHLGLFESVLF